MRERVDLKSPVRENRPPGSVRGASGNRRPYLDKSKGVGVLGRSGFQVEDEGCAAGGDLARFSQNEILGQFVQTFLEEAV